MLTGILAILAISAAAGMRIALPLLIIGFMESRSYWSNVPLLNQLHWLAIRSSTAWKKWKTSKIKD
ncbi:hypothetical protein Dacsa_1886 [Dactylococcopsis salina PCC 8305]|uniref:DUF4126 domain-containing protein n=1 Tax=Dactylococcopsis salina (strain PCC 8305) TaxID=13035 RepID=K9YW10_DACS8|nr:DUF4126 family protein [Dactylococcopsis salina]AFZ50540.1 hypothetical protein Dacsa_1886 [Dactylococcopsis salina PCC 8305]